jgi:hypothetical protein
MQNHYEILGVPENASEAWVQRQYQKHVDAAQQDTQISETERNATISRLTAARDVLADAERREAYDQVLLAATNKPGPGALLKRAIIPIVLLAIVVLAAGAYWQQVEQKRLWQEQEARERVVEAQRAEARAAEAKRRQEMLVAEAEARRVEEEERLRLAREQRETELKNEKYVAGKAFVPIVKSPAEIREEQQQRYLELQQRVIREREERLRRSETERDSAVARAEIARQKRYLDQQRYEEDQAAQRRAEVARTAERPPQGR